MLLHRKEKSKSSCVWCSKVVSLSLVSVLSEIFRYDADLSDYNESRLQSSFRKFYGRYNDLVCEYKLPLVHMLDDLFHSIG
jgi:hypothetical protein